MVGEEAEGSERVVLAPMSPLVGLWSGGGRVPSLRLLRHTQLRKKGVGGVERCGGGIGISSARSLPIRVAWCNTAAMVTAESYEGSLGPEELAFHFLLYLEKAESELLSGDFLHDCLLFVSLASESFRLPVPEVRSVRR